MCVFHFNLTFYLIFKPFGSFFYYSDKYYLLILFLNCYFFPSYFTKSNSRDVLIKVIGRRACDTPSSSGRSLGRVSGQQGPLSPSLSFFVSKEIKNIESGSEIRNGILVLHFSVIEFLLERILRPLGKSHLKSYFRTG